MPTKLLPKLENLTVSELTGMCSEYLKYIFAQMGGRARLRYLSLSVSCSCIDIFVDMSWISDMIEVELLEKLKFDIFE